ncbi:hypothetical protein BDF19DRAFT_438937 [Syncephalis fuscata]|nr:hypothetical protein BDF19DRAFT_438937 [Syncephalis fuscata]
MLHITILLKLAPIGFSLAILAKVLFSDLLVWFWFAYCLTKANWGWIFHLRIDLIYSLDTKRPARETLPYQLD